MNAIPSTWTELEAAGYVYENRTNCKGCGRQIEWWRTSSGRWMPIEIVAEAGGARMAHWGVCPKADEFRRKVQVKEPKKSSKTKAKARTAESGLLFRK